MMNQDAFTTFDNWFWGIYPSELNDADEVLTNIGKKFGLSDEEIIDTEDVAKEIATNDIKYADDPFSNLTLIIERSKAQAMVYAICKKKDLDENDFDIEVDGMGVCVTYKGENL